MFKNKHKMLKNLKPLFILLLWLLLERLKYVNSLLTQFTDNTIQLELFFRLQFEIKI